MGKSIINAEGGEVLKTPTGKSYAITGPSHKNGGVNLAVPDNSIIFSDRISVGNKTLADRKKLRDKYLDKLNAKGKYDILAKNTYKRAESNSAMEELGDIMAQTAIRNQIEGNQEDVPQAALGAGDYIGMASNIIGPLTNIARTKKAISASTNPMPNFYKNYGIAGLQQMQSINDDIDMQKASAVNRVNSTLKQKEQDASAQIDAAGGTLNLRRALRAGSKRSTDLAAADAISNIEGQTIGLKSNVKSKLVDLLNQRDAKVAEGAKDAFTYNDSVNRSNVASQLAANNELMTGFQSIGSALNTNKTNDLLQQQLGVQAAAQGMQINQDGSMSPINFATNDVSGLNSLTPDKQAMKLATGDVYAYGGTTGKKSPKMVFDNSENSQMNLPKINIPDPFKFLKSLFNPQENQQQNQQQVTKPNNMTTSNTNDKSGIQDADSILHFISGLESGHNPHVLAGGDVDKTITGLTIPELKKKYGSKAMGLYQIQMPTALDALKDAGIDPSKFVFDENGQKQIAKLLLKRRGYGTVTDPHTLALNLSKEWAALPKDKSNKSYYESKTNHALTDYDTYLSKITI